MLQGSLATKFTFQTNPLLSLHIRTHFQYILEYAKVLLSVLVIIFNRCSLLKDLKPKILKCRTSLREIVLVGLTLTLFIYIVDNLHTFCMSFHTIMSMVL